MSHEDDARPIPQGNGPRRDAPAPRPETGRGPGEGPAIEPEPHEPYVVDTRGRRPARASSRRSRAASTPPPPPGRMRRAGRPDPAYRDTPPAAPRPHRTRHPARTVRRVLLGVLVLVLVYVGFLVYAPYHAWNTVSRVDSTPADARGAAAAGHVYLLVGSDSREGLSAAQKKRLGTGSVAGRRTDSIILVYVPSGGGKSALISIPRDSYVPIPGHGSNKINAAFAFGGPKLLVETVEQATDLRIDGYIEVGFGGFVGVVDSLGGVRICVPFDMNDPKAHINLRKGCQMLSGPKALGYVRARYSDPRGDIGRAQRQRQFLGAIMKKVATPSTVLIPTRWWSVTHNVARGLVVGKDTSLMDAGRVAQALRGVSKDETLSLVVPLADVNYQTSAGSSVKWDSQRAKALFSMLRNGEALTTPPAGTDGKPSGG